MIRISCSQCDLINILDILKNYDDLLYTVHNACGDKNLAFVYINYRENEDMGTDTFKDYMKSFVIYLNRLVFNSFTDNIYVKIDDGSFMDYSGTTKLDGGSAAQNNVVGQINNMS